MSLLFRFGARLKAERRTVAISATEKSLLVARATPNKDKSCRANSWHRSVDLIAPRLSFHERNHRKSTSKRIHILRALDTWRQIFFEFFKKTTNHRLQLFRPRLTGSNTESECSNAHFCRSGRAVVGRAVGRPHLLSGVSTTAPLCWRKIDGSTASVQ